VKEILSKFERGTGQQVNPSKCSLMLGIGCDVEDRNKVMEILQVQTVMHEEKYLGLPTPQGRMGKESFKSTKERLSKKFSSWVVWHMSLGDKEVPIKSIAQAIPSYIMGVFKLPNTLCDEMEKMIRYF
jgi:hypothetical protein